MTNTYDFIFPCTLQLLNFSRKGDQLALNFPFM